ncbi:MAG: hypothetical protein GY856_25340 [bacterium]|nr:hypothetical protein [bacterium]
MLNSHNSGRVRRTSQVLPLVLLAFAILCPVRLFAGAFCGDGSPAYPVPECRDRTTTDEVDCGQANAVRLWPTNLRPGLPSEYLPEIRDTTDRIGGLTVPGAKSGHELFKSVDIVGDKLYVAYNAGIQVWDIGGNNAESPLRLVYRDGWMGQFLSFPPVSEQLTFVEDIAARHLTGTSKDLVVVSGKILVGPSIWTYDTGSYQITPHYQDTGTIARQVRIAELGGVYYMFAATDDGIAVYNASLALNLPSPCIDDAGTVCSGVYLGLFPDQILGRFLDVLEANGKIYVTSSYPIVMPLEIWEVGSPVIPGDADRKFDGASLGGGVRGTAMFEHSGTYYLSLVQDDTIKIFPIDDCLDSNGCTDLGTPVVSWPVSSTWSSIEQFLTYSESNGTPFLYYGLNTFNIDGPGVEQLLDLTLLGSGSVTVITASGGTYVDQCNGKTIDYWGDYHHRNDHGMRTFHPRVGKFSGSYFYRAAQSILDVHVRGVPPTEDPTVTAVVLGDPPFWFGEGVPFAATSQNCDGPEFWTWYADDTDAGGLGFGGATATVTWNRCAGEDCPDKQIKIWAIKDACAGDIGLVVDQAAVNLSDPEPRIRDIDVSPGANGAGQHPVCSILSFQADIDGKTPFDYVWEARNQNGELLASSTEEVFQWNTTGFNFDGRIFIDDFESGDASFWTIEMGSEEFPTASAVPVARREFLKDTLTALIDITLEATNPDSAEATSATEVTLTALGALALDNPAFTVTDLSLGQFQIQANTLNATEWKWQIEDPENGASTTCSAGYAKCHVIDWGAQSEILYVWEPPNIPGQYRVTLWARNCEDQVGITTETTIDVDEVVSTEPPVMTEFRVDESSIQSTLYPNAPCVYTNFFARELECPRNTAITFYATATGSLTAFKFDWEGDGSFEQSIPVGSPMTHSFASTGVKASQARAAFGSIQSTAMPLAQTLTIAVTK